MARFDWTSRKVWAVPAVWSYLLLSFEGRIPRLPFWIAAAALNVVAYLADRVALSLGGNPAAAVVGLGRGRRGAPRRGDLGPGGGRLLFHGARSGGPEGKFARGRDARPAAEADSDHGDEGRRAARPRSES